MIGLSEFIGCGGQDPDVLQVAVIGATVLKGRPVTAAVRSLAGDFAAAFFADDMAEVMRCLALLELAPDDILPPDDAELARVMAAGEGAAE